MRLTPEEKLAKNAAIARSQHAKKQAEQQQDRAAQQQFLAENLGFDATRNGYMCRLADGTIIYADSITTGVQTGLVSLYKPASGRDVIDGMP